MNVIWLSLFEPGNAPPHIEYGCAVGLVHVI